MWRPRGGAGEAFTTRTRIELYELVLTAPVGFVDLEAARYRLTIACALLYRRGYTWGVGLLVALKKRATMIGLFAEVVRRTILSRSEVMGEEQRTLQTMEASTTAI